jgi:hypothetical protein
MVNVENIKKYGTEAKVKASALGTFLIALVGTSWLGTTATDYVHALPDALEAPAYSLIAAGVSFLFGWSKKNTGGLSPSTFETVEAYLRRRGILK